MAIKGGKAKIFHEVSCRKHGKQPSVKHSHHQVRVGTPKNKRESLGGCPMCKLEARQLENDSFTTQSVEDKNTQKSKL